MKKKLEWLFAKTKCRLSERNQAKNEILKDIYGYQKGTYEEFGLAESQDKPMFEPCPRARPKAKTSVPGCHIYLEYLISLESCDIFIDLSTLFKLTFELPVQIC